MPVIGVTMIVPLFTPVHAVAVVDVLAVIPLVRLTIALIVLVHPPEASVTTIVCEPAATLVNVYGLAPINVVTPSNIKV